MDLTSFLRNGQLCDFSTGGGVCQRKKQREYSAKGPIWGDLGGLAARKVRTKGPRRVKDERLMTNP